MDTNTLLELLLLLEADESQFSLTAKIEEIRGLVSQNSPDQSNVIATKLTELLDAIRASRAALFSPTEIGFLDDVDAEEYFGVGLEHALIELTSGSKAFELSARMNEFQAARSAKYNKLMQMKNAMVDNGIAAYKQETDEIALTIPGENVSAEDVAKYLTTFSRFLRSVQECVAVPGVAPAQIVRVSRGSYDFFAQLDPASLKAVLDIIAGMSTIYLAGVEIRKQFPKSVTLTKKEQADVAELAEKIAKERVDAFIEETSTKLAKEDNDKKVRISQYLKILLKWLPLGIHIELVVQKQVEPVSEKTVADKAYKAKQEVLLKTGEMYKLPPEQLMLPVPDVDVNVDLDANLEIGNSSEQSSAKEVTETVTDETEPSEEAKTKE